MYLLNIALDIPLPRLFTYIADEIVAVGTRVLVQFGTKTMIGFVLENDQSKIQIDCVTKKLKPILTVFPEVLSEDSLKLIVFTSSYYHYPIGQTLFSSLPTILRKPKPINIRKTKPAKVNPISAALIELNQEQQEVVDKVSGNFATFHPALLYGITGSGKTEVYLDLIDKVLANKQQVLVLVPEINLTPQLLQRFRNRFPEVMMHVLTSHATDRERYLGYIRALNGEAQIIIGTRLAVFTPFHDLGIVIVDEEHDQSFKQNDSLRYNARDLAIWRTKFYNIPIVLGSATPSLESLYNYKLNKYSLYKLTNRGVKSALLPNIKLIDLNNAPQIDGLTNKAIDAIKERLSKKEMSLVFINRRGYSPIISCYDCGWVSQCKNCSSNMVYHRKIGELRCHHCGFSTGIPHSCPSCNNQYLHTVGQGTQKIEETLLQLFPEARIYRIDQDTINTKQAWADLYSKINNYEIDILVGTQMLAKGHDFHNLTLVVGVNLDSGLYSHDFRSTELLFNQLLQISGRAGRGAKPGEVLLQTNYPRHEVYQFLLRHDFPGFANYLMGERKNLLLPPYCYFAIFRVNGKDIIMVIDYLKQLLANLVKVKPDNLVICEPVPAVMQRLKNRERGQVLFYSQDRNTLHKFANSLLSQVEKIKLPAQMNWNLDIDPFEV